MAVDFDAVGSLNYNTSVSSFNDTSITVGTGTNRVLIYSLNFGWSIYSAPSSINVVWDSVGANQPLSLIVQGNNAASTALAQLWGLVAPVSGNKTLSVSWANTVDEVKGGAISFYGVDQTGGVTTFDSTNSASANNNLNSISVTTSTDDAYVGGFVCTPRTSLGGLTGGNGQIFANISGLIGAGAGYGINQATTNLGASTGSCNWGWVETNIKAHILTHTDTVTEAPELIGSTFTGSNGNGSVTVTGVKAGDKLIWLQSSMYQGGTVQMNTADYFEIIISSDDAIEQINNTDLSNWTFSAVFVRGV